MIRISKFFFFDLNRGDFPLEPILVGKTFVALTLKGEFGFAPGDIREHMNFWDGHINAVAHYLELSERHFVHSEFQEFGDERHENSRTDAENDTIKLAKRLWRKLTWKSIHVSIQSLPPFNALKTFEVAAKCLSFKDAADEHCVSSTAVSYRISTLEEWLGVKLFIRLTRSLQLTKEREA